MGKKLDALLGRTFKSSRFKTLISLALSRLSVLENQRQHRCSQARSDVTKLLVNGEHERALVRVEKVIKEQNMLDVFIMIEGYCNLLLERIRLIEQDRVCPDELEEAISGLIYAASRCGDLSELQGVSKIFITRYGKEFAARAVELRNNCGVSPKIIERLSTKFPSVEARMKILKEIASHNNISLQLEEVSATSEEMFDKRHTHIRPKSVSSISFGGSSELGDTLEVSKSMITDGPLTSSINARKYSDAADAAQEAFESAAYAAFAAKAAVELSRARPCDPSGRDKTGNAKIPGSDKMIQIYNENQGNDLKESTELSWSMYGSSSHVMDMAVNSIGQGRPMQEDIMFDDPYNKTPNEQSEQSRWMMETSDFDLDMHHAKISNDVMHKRIPSSINGKEAEVQSVHNLKLEKWPLSVRTRHISGY